MYELLQRAAFLPMQVKKDSIPYPKNSDATLNQYMIYKLLQRAVLIHYHQGLAETVLQEKDTLFVV